MREGISVITLSKDRPDLFERCAAAVQDVFPVLDRILVQNGTDSLTVSIARNSGWKVFEPGRNTSFSEGNNAAARASNSSHVLLLNNDVILAPDSTTAMWRLQDFEIVGCHLSDPEGSPLHSGILFDRELYPRHLTVTSQPAADEFTLPAVTFAAVMLRRDMFDRLGGLDDQFWYGFEDVDYCLRVREQSGRIAIPADSRAAHAQCSTRNPRETDPENLRLFEQKWITTGRLARALGIML